MIAALTDAVIEKRRLLLAQARFASVDDIPSDIKFDQYYTRTDVAELCYAEFRKHFDPAKFLLIEPSAGTGSFFKLFPPGSLAYDLEPKYPGIRNRDFLKVDLPCDVDIAVIGNPPFGKNAKMARRFFNHAARRATVIAMILPKTFRKASMINKLERGFHLLTEIILPRDSFVFRNRPFDIPAVFQIWVKREESRPIVLEETTHPDFEFVKVGPADFVMRRVGANAGGIHDNFNASRRCNYFIKDNGHGSVRAKMLSLDFTRVKDNVAGTPSVAKSELIALYRELTEGAH